MKRFFLLAFFSFEIFSQTTLRASFKQPFKVLSEQNDKVHFLNSPQQTFLAYYDNELKLWNLKGKLLKKIDTNQDFLFDIAVSSNGKFWLSYGYEKLQIWNGFSQNLIKSTKLLDASHFTFLPNQESFAFSQCKNRTQEDCQESIVRIKKLENLAPIMDFQVNRKNIASIDISRNGKFLAIIANDFTYENPQNEKSVLRIFSLFKKKKADSIFAKKGQSYRLIKFSPDSKKLALIENGQNIKIWSMEKKQWITRFSHSKVLSIAFSPNQEFLASADRNSFVKIWSLKNQKLVKFFQVGQKEIHQLAFSPNGEILVTVEHLGRTSLWCIQKKKYCN